MKEPKSKAKPRNTLAKQIVALTKCGLVDDAYKAGMAAIYGKPLSLEENYLREFYESVVNVEHAMNCHADSGTPPDFYGLGAAVKKHEEIISSLFLQAVLRYDREAVIRLADAVWFFKDKRNAYDSPADRDRSKLLWLKMSILANPQKIMTVRQVAKFLNRSTDSQDGFSAIRRKCKELDIPVKPSRKISRK